ncbi:hypothetical protein J4E93_009877 [Alternaria ventricosa]|uniref:uncharacterized protein n=1 Tax=Alternaria ventricosa TaxID=1187951 RepID=UPI0020C4A18F|nr:uncharacterized protein J4E93_009877 [Alternaria ventricosa]KAI4638577.1 hypothetical protein J4E93_009877 [Alternaria ventricosa]
MASDALSQPKTLLAAAPTLRAQLSNTERLQLSGLAEALRNELERPDEAVFRVTFNESGHYLAIRLALQWGVFEALGDVGEKGVSCERIAEGAGADARLVARFLRHLAANGTIREVDVDTYASTRLSASLRQKSFKDAIHFMFDDFYNEVLLVDIGGGDAGDLGLLREALGGDVKGRLVLQELEHIVDRSEQDGFEAHVGDWNEVQPIKGARAYMLQHVLHDFSSDDSCRRILRNIVLAMKPGYSTLLIKELLIPDRNAPWAFTAMDVNVMQSLSGQERTESQFRELLESVGLKIEGIWSHENALDVVIEASLP